MKKLLITGFDPFGGESVNPAWEAVRRLPNQVGEFEVYKRMIPTVFAEAPKKVQMFAEEIHPDVILCVGQAGGRAAVTPERVGINVRDAGITDNAGNQPTDEPIVIDGPDAYFATVPIKKMVQAIESAGFPAAVSNTAGTFVCNDVLYSTLHFCAGTGTKVGFIHVPFLPEQGNPSLELEKTAAALEAAIRACDEI